MNGFIVIGMVVWAFFIATALHVRLREKNAGSRVPSRARIGAVKCIHRFDKPVSRIKAPENF
jgi:hypothetical protein